jgi:hypothetical protein
VLPDNDTTQFQTDGLLYALFHHCGTITLLKTLEGKKPEESSNHYKLWR